VAPFEFLMTPYGNPVPDGLFRQSRAYEDWNSLAGLMHCRTPCEQVECSTDENWLASITATMRNVLMEAQA
jgi:hypothetical protein